MQVAGRKAQCFANPVAATDVDATSDLVTDPSGLESALPMAGQLKHLQLQAWWPYWRHLYHLCSKHLWAF